LIKKKSISFYRRQHCQLESVSLCQESVLHPTLEIIKRRGLGQEGWCSKNDVVIAFGVGERKRGSLGVYLCAREAAIE